MTRTSCLIFQASTTLELSLHLAAFLSSIDPYSLTFELVNHTHIRLVTLLGANAFISAFSGHYSGISDLGAIYTQLYSF